MRIPKPSGDNSAGDDHHGVSRCRERGTSSSNPTRHLLDAVHHHYKNRSPSGANGDPGRSTTGQTQVVVSSNASRSALLSRPLGEHEGAYFTQDPFALLETPCNPAAFAAPASGISSNVPNMLPWLCATSPSPSLARCLKTSRPVPGTASSSRDQHMPAMQAARALPPTQREVRRTDATRSTAGVAARGAAVLPRASCSKRSIALLPGGSAARPPARSSTTAATASAPTRASRVRF